MYYTRIFRPVKGTPGGTRKSMDEDDDGGRFLLGLEVVVELDGAHQDLVETDLDRLPAALLAVGDAQDMEAELALHDAARLAVLEGEGRRLDLRRQQAPSDQSAVAAV